MVFLFQLSKTREAASLQNNWFSATSGSKYAGPSDIEAARNNSVIYLLALTSKNTGVLDDVAKLGGKLETKGQYGMSYSLKVEADKKNPGAYNIALTAKGTGFKDDVHNIWVNNSKSQIFIDGKQITATPAAGSVYSRIAGGTENLSKENMQLTVLLGQILTNAYVDVHTSAGKKTNAKNVKLDGKWGAKETNPAYMSILAETMVKTVPRGFGSATVSQYQDYAPILNQKNAWNTAEFFGLTLGKNNRKQYSKIYTDAVFEYYKKGTGDKTVPKTEDEYRQLFFAATAYLQAKEGLKSDGLFGDKTMAKVDELVKNGVILKSSVQATNPNEFMEYMKYVGDKTLKVYHLKK